MKTFNIFHNDFNIASSFTHDAQRMHMFFPKDMFFPEDISKYSHHIHQSFEDDAKQLINTLKQNGYDIL